MLRFSDPIHRATALSFCSGLRRGRARLNAPVLAVAKPTPILYDILSIAPTAKQEEIKAAFKKAVLKWHPDTCQSPADKKLFTERLKQVLEAYEVLSDVLRRHCYDLSIGFGGGFEGRDTIAEYKVREIRLEGLSRRVRSEDTWSARVRRAHEHNQSGPLD
ncbi:Chaperone protein DnaJ [Rhynchospora pubera]|uniref:Chaperone protein DnaJ n=1 Tax=Rhynchospora pubera TaxID=906938 RepID=A0AAV8CFZ3_9POAL|nr:Chaperone protein DnaJ [Rhynchospora pubera]